LAAVLHTPVSEWLAMPLTELAAWFPIYNRIVKESES